VLVLSDRFLMPFRIRLIVAMVERMEGLRPYRKRRGYDAIRHSLVSDDNFPGLHLFPPVIVSSGESAKIDPLTDS
jgi:hypothetical protein